MHYTNVDPERFARRFERDPSNAFNIDTEVAARELLSPYVVQHPMMGCAPMMGWVQLLLAAPAALKAAQQLMPVAKSALSAVRKVQAAKKKMPPPPAPRPEPAPDEDEEAAHAVMGALVAAGNNPYTSAAAVMGLNLNPLSWAKKGLQAVTRGAYNLARGKRPWASVGPSGKPRTPTDARQRAIRAGLPPEPAQLFPEAPAPDPYGQSYGPAPEPMTDAEYAQLYPQPISDPYSPMIMGARRRRRR